jgi:hypothetical protein
MTAVLALILGGFAEPTSRPSDKLKERSTWTGTEHGGRIKNEQQDFYAELRVTERTDNEFRARYMVQTGSIRHAVTCDGRVTDDGRFSLKPIRVERGGS